MNKYNLKSTTAILKNNLNDTRNYICCTYSVCHGPLNLRYSNHQYLKLKEKYQKISAKFTF